MGYSGYVPCRCLFERPDPPVGVIETIDECGDVRDNLDYGLRDAWLRLGAWKAVHCPHPEFELASEVIANAGLMAMFRDEVWSLGGLPVLAARLPTANGGCIPRAEVPGALLELDGFRARAAGRPLTRLIDSRSGAVLHDGPLPDEGVWSFQRDHELGFDADGFFVREDVAWIRTGGAHERQFVERFRAKRVDQVMNGPAMGDSQSVTFTDRESRRSYVSPAPMSAPTVDPDGSVRWQIPAAFHVETIPRAADWFDEVIDPLRRILVVAKDHSSSVNWT